VVVVGNVLGGSGIGWTNVTTTVDGGVLRDVPAAP
jgi:hypothetical protein